MFKRNATVFIAIFLCACLTGCSLEIPSLSEAKDVVSAVMQYSESGKLPDNIQEIIAEKYPDDPNVDIKDVIVSTSRNEALLLAKKYYELSRPNIESDMREQFEKLVKWTPTFDGKNIEKEFCRSNSLNVSVLVTYTNAKNTYLALACAVFSGDPDNSNAASNLGTAIATYCDELLSEGNASGRLKKDEFYNDSAKMYYYALGIAALNNKEKGSKETNGKDILDNRPSILACLGNLLLDMKKFEDAFAVFRSALDINERYWPARMGLYNYYMAVKQYRRALDLIAEDAKYYPACARTVSNLTKKLPDEDDIPDENTSEEELEKMMGELNKVPAVTAADFIQELDPKAAAKMNKDIGNLRQKMKFKSPDAQFLLQYTDFDAFAKPGPQAAIYALAEYAAKRSTKTAGRDTEAALKKEFEMLEKFGVKIDPGFDVDNLDKMVQDAIKNPEKYENFKPDVKVSGLEGLERNVQKYAQETKQAISEARRGDDCTKAYEQLAKLRPEFKVMTINPYEYGNPNDLLIQRYNVLALSSKMDTYDFYLQKLNTKTASAFPGILERCSRQIEPLKKQLQDKIDAVEKENISEAEKKVKVHRLHVQYYTKFNNIERPYWGQATEAASIAYRKICKYSEQMYNDCTKHIMLISDAGIRDRLEEEVRSSLTVAYNLALNNIVSAYSIVPYYNIAACGCDPEEIRALEEQIRLRQKQIANALIKKNMRDKKRFDAGILDENSKYYKEFIKKYEVDFNFFYIKGKISPYKSNWEFSASAWDLTLSYREVTNHIRNTTTVNAEVEVGSDVDLFDYADSVPEGDKFKIGLSAKLGFSGVKDGNGKFYPDEFDVYAGGGANVNVGAFNFSAGVEASAIRGTREYAAVAVTGDPAIDKLKFNQETKDLLEAMPGVSKEIWSGEYKENDDEE